MIFSRKWVAFRMFFIWSTLPANEEPFGDDRAELLLQRGLELFAGTEKVRVVSKVQFDILSYSVFYWILINTGSNTVH